MMRGSLPHCRAGFSAGCCSSGTYPPKLVLYLGAACPAGADTSKIYPSGTSIRVRYDATRGRHWPGGQPTGQTALAPRLSELQVCPETRLSYPADITGRALTMAQEEEDAVPWGEAGVLELRPAPAAVFLPARETIAERALGTFRDVSHPLSLSFHLVPIPRASGPEMTSMGPP